MREMYRSGEIVRELPGELPEDAQALKGETF